MHWGMPGGLAGPISQNAWCSHTTLNQYVVGQLKLELDFSNRLLNHSMHKPLNQFKSLYVHLLQVNHV